MGLEALVAILERALANWGVEVESPCRLRDTRTGTLREHDVVLRTSVGHHDLVVAVECRDRSRPVGVPQVEAFHQKCLDTGVSRGAIVSANGYYQTARKKASSLGIRCLDLAEVEAFDWAGFGGVLVFRSQLRHVQATFVVREVGVVADRSRRLVDSTGAEISDDKVIRLVQHVLRGHPDLTFKAGETKVPFDFLLDGVFAEVGSQRYTVKGVKGIAHFETKASRQPYLFLKYEDRQQGRGLAEAVVAEIKEGPLRGRLVIALDENRNATASFITCGQDEETGPVEDGHAGPNNEQV